MIESHTGVKYHISTLPQSQFDQRVTIVLLITRIKSITHYTVEPALSLYPALFQLHQRVESKNIVSNKETCPREDGPLTFSLLLLSRRITVCV